MIGYGAVPFFAETRDVLLPILVSTFAGDGLYPPFSAPPPPSGDAARAVITWGDRSAGATELSRPGAGCRRHGLHCRRCVHDPATGERRTLPANLIDGHLRQRDEVAQRMRAAIKTGIKFAVGTDGMHGGLAQEVQYLVDFGATPMRALMAATSHAAKVCGLAESIGTLESGKFGDIIGVKGNPLRGHWRPEKSRNRYSQRRNQASRRSDKTK